MPLKRCVPAALIALALACAKGDSPAPPSVSGPSNTVETPAGVAALSGECVRDAYCGAHNELFQPDNPYPCGSCCANKGNCTWYAWYKAKQVWGISLSDDWSSASNWAHEAWLDGILVLPDPAENTIGVNTEAAGGLGHVAWVIAPLEGGRVLVEEMRCDVGPGEVRTSAYDREYFNAGFIYPASIPRECRPTAADFGDDPDGATCPSPPPTPPPMPPPGSAPAITTANPLPPASVGLGYTFQFQAAGGAPPYSWGIVAGSLPGNVTMTPWGLFGGIPGSSGSYTFLVRVSDMQSRSAEGWFGLTVSGTTPPPTTQPPGGSPVITSPSTLPQGIVGAFYSFTFQATGGTPPYAWTLWSGNRPPGVTFWADGQVNGFPGSAGTWTFTMRATDTQGRFGEKGFLWTTTASAPPPTTQPPPPSTTQPASLTITTGSQLPNGTVGRQYQASLLASGGTYPYSWSRVGGTLPPGLSLMNNGAIIGSPTASGSFGFRARVTDTAMSYREKEFQVFVSPAPNPTPTPPPSTLRITTNSLPDARVGVWYETQLQATGGDPPYHWEPVQGALGSFAFPPDGRILGTPNSAGTFNFTMRVRDAQGAWADKALSIRVDP